MGKNGTPRADLDWTPAPPERWSGRRVWVVGGTNGIGRALARRLADQGAHVTVVGRTLRDDGVPNLAFRRADLSSLREARSLAEDIPARHVELVILTTGVFATPQRTVTAEGIERDLAISYLSRFVLMRALAPRLGTSVEARPRVFVMGFPGTGEVGHVDDPNSEQSYQPIRAHLNTVAANEALVLDAVVRYPHLDTFGLNPGLIQTDIRGDFFGHGTWSHRLLETLIGFVTPSTESYAERIVPLLGASELDGRSGVHFNKRGTAIRPSPGLSDGLVARWMSASERLVDRALAPAEAR
ncbi:MAG: SDR family NAD(P)-dependent oxidoreductase [Myxococcota bacterium]